VGRVRGLAALAALYGSTATPPSADRPHVRSPIDLCNSGARADRGCVERHRLPAGGTARRDVAVLEMGVDGFVDALRVAAVGVEVP
jgi:hypothetical protein